MRLRSTHSHGEPTNMPLKSSLRAFASNLALAALCASLFAAAARSGPPGVAGTHKESVNDPKYSMTAFTLDVPANWKFAGVIAREGGCHSGGPSMKFTVLSNDGVTSIIQMPSTQWNW